MLFVAAPIYLLFELGIVFAKIAARRHDRGRKHDIDETLALIVKRISAWLTQQESVLGNAGYRPVDDLRTRSP